MASIVACCVCSEERQNSFRVDNRKCLILKPILLEMFFEKQDVILKLFSSSSFICRPCFNRVVNFHLFYKDMFCNLERQFGEKKRAANFSPEQIIVEESNGHPVTPHASIAVLSSQTSKKIKVSAEKGSASARQPLHEIIVQNDVINTQHNEDRLENIPLVDRVSCGNNLRKNQSLDKENINPVPSRNICEVPLQKQTAKPFEQTVYRQDHSVQGTFGYSMTVDRSLTPEHSYCNRDLPRKELFPVQPDKPNVMSDEMVVCVKRMGKEVTSVSSKRIGEESILLAGKKMKDLAEKGDQLIENIIAEMQQRTPFFYELLFEAIGRKDNKKSIVAVIYSLVLFTRNPEINAFQRLISSICIRGHADDMVFTRLNKVGISLSTSSKARILEEAANINQKALIEYLKRNPLLKITGDNLDIYIKRTVQSVDKRNLDLHLFATNAISVRLSKQDMDRKAQVLPEILNSSILKASDFELDKLKTAYCYLIARVLSTMETFKWMKGIVPPHIIEVQHLSSMSEKSFVFELPIQHKNEAKYEDVVDIMEAYERTLQQYFREAYGNIDMLDKFRVVVGGDQLTKVRFVGAINLRRLSPTATGRFDHLRPVVCELWHLKQDFVEKAYKKLYSVSSQKQEGSLSFFRNLLRKTDVTGKVKGKFHSHCEFLKMITSCMIKEQVMELYNMQSQEDTPHGLPDMTNASRKVKHQVMMSVTGLIVDLYYNLGNEKEGIEDNEDFLFNYSRQLCIWGLHLLNLEDTAKEGDVSRVIPNLKTCIPFFYSHSCLSKYLVECIDYIFKVDFQLSPLDKLRVLEGSFVNVRGGAGNNVEADLVQEHSVRHQKELIRGLGANKTENAINIVTAAAPIISSVCSNFDTAHKVPKKSSRHSRSLTDKDIDIVSKKLRDIRPFLFKPGRTCSGHDSISRTPIDTVDIHKMSIDLDRIISNLKEGPFIMSEEESEEEESGDEDFDGEDDLPDIM